MSPIQNKWECVCFMLEFLGIDCSFVWKVFLWIHLLKWDITVLLLNLKYSNSWFSVIFYITEIPLPNEQSRLDILKIHAQPIAKHGEIGRS